MLWINNNVIKGVFFMIDWRPLYDKIADRMMPYFDNTPPGFQKFARWWAYNVPHFLVLIFQFFLGIWLFTSAIYNRLGFERTALLMLFIIIFILRMGKRKK